ncbi:uncharacterized protein LOC141686543 [Apium graveolens]|uniref:uncharacterized protein LOC141686543 n=1 Tax=Apium graveolens TaxID=4045 RepID=UPI003D7B59DA
MDSIEGLPKVRGKSILMVVVNRLSKYAHFIPLAHPYTAIFIATTFFTEVFRLHGLPKSIVSGRDKAQQRMKNAYDSGHRELTFSVGEWVWLRLQPYRQLTIARQNYHKLLPKYFGPYRILAKIGVVAYKMELPEDSRIHDIFHVSLLKEYKGPPPGNVSNLPPLFEGKALPIHQSIVHSRLNRGQRELLVLWEGNPHENATWEPLENFRAVYPEFKLEGKLKGEVGSDDMDAFIGRRYERRRNKFA